MPINVILADDHAILRESMKTHLQREGFTVVGEAANGLEAVRLAGELHPQLAILDFSMPLMNGIDAAREIHSVSPKTKTILVTMHNENEHVFTALRNRVSGYVLKQQAIADLLQAAREVHRGNTYLSPGISQQVVQSLLNGCTLPTDPLSPRERQVLQMIAEGKSNKDIAAHLGVSARTAESHRANLMDKLDIHDTAGLVRYAIRTGLVDA